MPVMVRVSVAVLCRDRFLVVDVLFGGIYYAW